MSEGLPAIEALLGRAIGQVHSSEANEAIAQMRQDEGTEDRPAMSYEVVLPAENPVEYLTETLLPRLVYFLDCAGAKLPQCPGVFLSLFQGDRLFFIRAADAVDELAKITGLLPARMTELFGAMSKP